MMNQLQVHEQRRKTFFFIEASFKRDIRKQEFKESITSRNQKEVGL